MNHVYEGLHNFCMLDFHIKMVINSCALFENAHYTIYIEVISVCLVMGKLKTLDLQVMLNITIVRYWLQSFL